ncbi:MAG TPA: hypothetical protein EYP53_01255 [Candidatus Latescibacteria bacterium]|nr:hypothetical protein [Candidatus Latescibacterota bacterium]
MSHVLNRPLAVKLRGALPLRIAMGGGWLRVKAIVEHWRETGRWWEGETEKEFYQVETERGEFILYQDRSNKNWFLYRAMD